MYRLRGITDPLLRSDAGTDDIRNDLAGLSAHAASRLGRSGRVCARTGDEIILGQIRAHRRRLHSYQGRRRVLHGSGNLQLRHAGRNSQRRSGHRRCRHMFCIRRHSSCQPQSHRRSVGIGHHQGQTDHECAGLSAHPVSDCRRTGIFRHLRQIAGAGPSRTSQSILCRHHP
ncbi:hypothetical protein GALL_553010 [mine drainage metagenome]|uniref:Uncharacterized protein n=1 Tax=mine drainage metagenome TaxID=410659 RepID=A0A1J5NWP1_9ZZZZ